MENWEKDIRTLLKEHDPLGDIDFSDSLLTQLESEILNKTTSNSEDRPTLGKNAVLSFSMQCYRIRHYFRKLSPVIVVLGLIILGLNEAVRDPSPSLAHQELVSKMYSNQTMQNSIISSGVGVGFAVLDMKEPMSKEAFLEMVRDL